jgi:ferric-dicitrate binding protein FerR (iron transport regulator)
MKNKINSLIARVLSREASLDDHLRLSIWLNENEQNREEFSRLKSYWDAEISFNEIPASFAGMENIQQKIKTLKRKRKNRLLWRAWIPAAVSVAVFVYLATVFPAHHKMNTPRELHTWLTSGNRAHFTLYDGTKITLNKNSRLTCASTYGTNDRHVTLEGEAYFEVVPDPENPFQVTVEGEAKDAIITVLGTVFDVKAKTDKSQVTTTLLEGSIVFETAGQTIKMQPNQQLTYTFATQNINLSDVNATDEVLWKDGLMKYKAVTLMELAEELGKRFDTTVIIQNRELRKPSVTVSGTFTEEQSLDQILDVVSSSLSIKWTKDEKDYYIK